MPELSFFFFNDTATTEIYTLSLHDALPICAAAAGPTEGDRAPLPGRRELRAGGQPGPGDRVRPEHRACRADGADAGRDRKSTRLNSSHANISYAVFCLKKKNRAGVRDG